MAKELVVTVRIPLPDVPRIAEKMAHAAVIAGAKQMFPVDKLKAVGGTVAFEVKDKK